MDPQTATHTLREPAQLKCTWTKHKSHFVPEFTGKKLEARFSTLIKHRPLPLPKNPSVWRRCVGNFKRNFKEHVKVPMSACVKHCFCGFCQASKMAAPWSSNSGCTLRHPFSVFVCHTQSRAVISKVCALCFSRSKSD